MDGSPDAVSLVVRAETFTDLIVWQPEEEYETHGQRISCRRLTTDGFLAMVRTDRQGKLTGYVLGDGSRLQYDGRTLVEADEPLSVSADQDQVHATGTRQARQNLPPLAAKGRLGLAGPAAAVYIDGDLVESPIVTGQMVEIGN